MHSRARPPSLFGAPPGSAAPHHHAPPSSLDARRALGLHRTGLADLTNSPAATASANGAGSGSAAAKGSARSLSSSFTTPSGLAALSSTTSRRPGSAASAYASAGSGAGAGPASHAFRGKLFFFNAVDSLAKTETDELTHLIQSAGGSVLVFFSKDVTHVIVDDAVKANLASILSTGAKSASASALLRQPTPRAALSSNVLHTAVKESMDIWSVSALRKEIRLRCPAASNNNTNSRRTSGLSSVLDLHGSRDASAESNRAQAVARLRKASRVDTTTGRGGGSSSASAGGAIEGVNIRRLVSPYFVLLDGQAHYRPPIVQEYTDASVLPHLYVHTDPNASPFLASEHGPLAIERAPDRSASLAHLPAALGPPPAFLPQPKEDHAEFLEDLAQIADDPDLVESLRALIPARPGYCEQCRAKFDTLTDHLASALHRSRVLDPDTWRSLDKYAAQYARPPSHPAALAARNASEAGAVQRKLVNPSLAAGPPPPPPVAAPAVEDTRTAATAHSPSPRVATGGLPRTRSNTTMAVRSPMFNVDSSSTDMGLGLGGGGIDSPVGAAEPLFSPPPPPPPEMQPPALPPAPLSTTSSLTSDLGSDPLAPPVVVHTATPMPPTASAKAWPAVQAAAQSAPRPVVVDVDAFNSETSSEIDIIGDGGVHADEMVVDPVSRPLPPPRAAAAAGVTVYHRGTDDDDLFGAAGAAAGDSDLGSTSEDESLASTIHRSRPSADNRRSASPTPANRKRTRGRAAPRAAAADGSDGSETEEEDDDEEEDELVAKRRRVGSFDAAAAAAHAAAAVPDFDFGDSESSVMDIYGDEDDEDNVGSAPGRGPPQPPVMGPPPSRRLSAIPTPLSAAGGGASSRPAATPYQYQSQPAAARDSAPRTRSRPSTSGTTSSRRESVAHAWPDTEGGVWNMYASGITPAQSVVGETPRVAATPSWTAAAASGVTTPWTAPTPSVRPSAAADLSALVFDRETSPMLVSPVDDEFEFDFLPNDSGAGAGTGVAVAVSAAPPLTLPAPPSLHDPQYHRGAGAGAGPGTGAYSQIPESFDIASRPTDSAVTMAALTSAASGHDSAKSPPHLRGFTGFHSAIDTSVADMLLATGGAHGQGHPYLSSSAALLPSASSPPASAPGNAIQLAAESLFTDVPSEMTQQQNGGAAGQLPPLPLPPLPLPPLPQPAFGLVSSPGPRALAATAFRNAAAARGVGVQSSPGGFRGAGGVEISSPRRPPPLPTPALRGSPIPLPAPSSPAPPPPPPPPQQQQQQHARGTPVRIKFIMSESRPGTSSSRYNNTSPAPNAGPIPQHLLAHLPPPPVLPTVASSPALHRSGAAGPLQTPAHSSTSGGIATANDRGGGVGGGTPDSRFRTTPPMAISSGAIIVPPISPLVDGAVPADLPRRRRARDVPVEMVNVEETTDDDDGGPMPLTSSSSPAAGGGRAGSASPTPHRRHSNQQHNRGQAQTQTQLLTPRS
ncbi:Cdc7p-Dbf4p kinase complex regulatory subunit [Blastocladiella emersonii ATCC 22665]|nr:Cdc7p-Dbf4p kinase complex regulatory subunit [Blastocladiella emersonii ATCC 22665]